MISIRAAILGDAREIAIMRQGIHREGHYFRETELDFDRCFVGERERLTSLHGRSDCAAFVAAAARDVLGWIYFTGDDVPSIPHAGLLEIGIAPDHRRRGIGSKLMAALIDWATLHPEIERILADCFAANLPALAFFRRFNFIDAGWPEGSSANVVRLCRRTQ